MTVLPRSLVISLLMAVLALAVAHAADEPTSVPPRMDRPTEAAVRNEFAELCRRFRDGDDPFFGRAIIGELRNQLAAPIRNPEVQVGVRARLAIELLRLGEVAEAVTLLESAGQLADRHALGERLRLRIMRDLAIAHLRAAEVENCVDHHVAASCIVPIGPDAVHHRPEHARAAAELYTTYLTQHPDDYHLRWLLALARATAGDDPKRVPAAWRLPAGAMVDTVPIRPWRDIAGVLGVGVVDLAGGAVMDDFDGDGRLDLVTSTNDPCDSLKAFRNDGRGGFENVTKAWGLDVQWGGLNLIHGDVDGDGRLDLLVLRGGWWGAHGRIRNSLLHNTLHDDGPRFVDITVAAGLAAPAYPTQTAAFADVDGDGDLDLFVGNEAGPERPHPSQLFENRGPGERDGRLSGPPVRFVDITRAAGIDTVAFVKGVTWGDADEDGDPDLYLSSIGPNQLWRNDSERIGRDPAGRDPAGRGTSHIAFTDVTTAAGVAEPRGSSFATWFFDADQDGDLDLFVTDYGTPYTAVTASYFVPSPPTPGHPVLYRNDGERDGAPRFVDVSRAAGLTRPTLPMGANYGDLDNDGWPDLYLGTGVPDYEALIPNVTLRNAGGRFEDVTFSSGLGHLQKGHGVAWGDLDDDGDQDLLHQLGGQYPGDAYANALFENPGNGHHWLTFELIGVEANRFGVGARIAVTVRDGERQGGRSRTIHVLAGSGGSFGGSSLRQEIGLGDATAIEQVEIRWPGSGTVQHLDDLVMDRLYRVREGTAAELVDRRPIRLGHDR